MTTQTQAIWSFDSICVRYSRGVQSTLRQEKTQRSRSVAIQSDEGRAVAQSHVFIAVLGHITEPARIGLFFGWVPKGLRDVADSIVVRSRYKTFGKAESCIMPRTDQRHRFVVW